MKEPARHTVTAALPYANGPLHIGHIAGAYLPSDIYVRSLRQRGKDVLFVCGSDEHGAAAITIRALKEGTTPRAIVDKYHALMGKALRTSACTSTSTTAPAASHEETSRLLSQAERERRLTQQEEQQYSTRRRSSSWRTATSWAPAPPAPTPMPTATNARSAAARLSPKDLIDPAQRPQRCQAGAAAHHALVPAHGAQPAMGG